MRKLRARTGAQMSEAEKRTLELLRQWGTAPIPARASNEAELEEAATLAIASAMRQTTRRRQVQGFWRRAAVGIAAAAACAAAFVYSSSLPAPVAKVVPAERTGQQAASQPGVSTALLDGRATRIRAGSGDAIVSGELVLPGDVVLASVGTVAVVAQSTRAVLEQGSELRVESLSGELELWRLTEGVAAFSVDPHRKKPVHILTPDGRVEVVGTEFRVTVRPDSRAPGMPRSSVEVTKGRVRVAHADGVAILNPGQRWDAAVAQGEEANSATSPASDSPRATARVWKRSPSVQRAEARKETTLAEENRLFQAALAARNAGNDGACERLLGDFVRRFPASALRHEAELERNRARSRLGGKQ
jgi:ferric-dicitrate binding protein FerR (iron transport regulator)